jgi:hypothetical protein
VEQPLRSLGDVVPHGRPTLGVAHRGQHAARLVQREVDEILAHVDASSVDTHDGGARIHSHSLAADDLAVHRNTAGGDQFLTRAPRTEPGRGQHFLQTYAFGLLLR